LDPLTWDYPELTNYQYASNNPILNIDIDGLEGTSALDAFKVGGKNFSKNFDEVILKPGVRKASSSVAQGASKAVSKSTSLVLTAAISVVNGAIAVSERVSDQWDILKWNTSNRLNSSSQAVSDKFDGIVAGVRQAAEDEGKPVLLKTFEVALAIDTRDGNSILANTALGGRVKGLSALYRTVELENQAFNSFTAFKRFNGAAGKGQAWHHIVEQNANNIERFGAKTINVEQNLMRLPHGKGSLHSKVSGYYSSKQPFTNGKTVRQWLNSKSYQEQYDFGLQTLKKFGWRP
jgi:hypothetical protein